MNDATELESSLAGAIDFFQSLRRKLGTLETDASAQHDQLRTLASALVTLEQGQKTDRQIVASLSSGLVKLQADGRLLEQQLNAAETLAARFQHDQQQIQQALSAMADDLRTQGATWRQELEAILTEKLAPTDEIVPLQQTVQAHQEQFKQLATMAEAQHKRLLQFDIVLETLDQNSHLLSQTLGALQADFERHEQAFSALDQTAGIDETARRQLQAQQQQLDELTTSSTAAGQDLQAVRNDIIGIRSEFETQRRALADAVQVRLDLQKHQDRLKHLETLMSKVSADTNSTRQILNVVQSDLTTQSDTLRELDQNWRDSLSTYQDRLSFVEIVVAGSGSGAAAFPTGASSPSAAQPAPVVPADHQPPLIGYEPLEALEAALATTRDQHHERLNALDAALAHTLERHQALEKALSAVQTTLGRQDEHFAELRSALSEPLDAAQQRLGKLEAAFETLYQFHDTPPRADIDAVIDPLRQAIADQNAALEETQQLAWAQIQDLQQRLSEAEATLDSARQAPEPAAGQAEAEAVFASLRQAIADQNAALEETQQLAWAQIQDLQQRLSEAEAALDSSSQTPATASIDAEAALTGLRGDLSVQAGMLDEFKETLSTQAGALEEFRGTTRQQLTALNATRDAQQQAFHDAVTQIANLQQTVRQLQQPAPAPAIDPQRLETTELYAQETRRNLDSLQEAVAALETRLSSQSQAFSSHFEQFRSLNADIHALQQQTARLDAAPRQFGALEQKLANHEQGMNQLRETIEQIQMDSQQMGEALQQSAESPVAAVAARLDEQQEQLTHLTTTLETIRADSKAAQETVVTMATNVAKRIHEIQNLLVATENTQSERLQEVEQKLIHLQAAFETLENQRKPRKWFSMPASLTSIMLTVGVSGLAILAQVIWTID